MATQLPSAKGREILFLLLYAQDFTAKNDPALVQFVSDQLKVAARHVKELLPKLVCVDDKIDELDQKINEAAHDYELGRIPKIELNVLRLSLFELFFDDTIPGEVAISEGVRLAKKFGSQECFKFVNGLLDAIYKNRSVLEVS